LKNSSTGVRDSQALKFGCSAAAQRLEVVVDMADLFEVVLVDVLVV
jgi:hypothetical protein